MYLGKIGDKENVTEPMQKGIRKDISRLLALFKTRFETANYHYDRFLKNNLEWLGKSFNVNTSPHEASKQKGGYFNYSFLVYSTRFPKTTRCYI